MLFWEDVLNVLPPNLCRHLFFLVLGSGPVGAGMYFYICLWSLGRGIKCALEIGTI